MCSNLVVFKDSLRFANDKVLTPLQYLSIIYLSYYRRKLWMLNSFFMYFLGLARWLKQVSSVESQLWLKMPSRIISCISYLTQCSLRYCVMHRMNSKWLWGRLILSHLSTPYCLPLSILYRESLTLKMQNLFMSHNAFLHIETANRFFKRYYTAIKKL